MRKLNVHRNDTHTNFHADCRVFRAGEGKKTSAVTLATRSIQEKLVEIRFSVKKKTLNCFQATIRFSKIVVFCEHSIHYGLDAPHDGVRYEISNR